MKTGLDDRARAAGVARHWVDAAGRRQRVDDETLAAILEALGDPGETQEAEPLVTAEVGREVRLPSGRIAPAFAQPGYYEQDGAVVAVAPERGWTIADAAPGRRPWGAAVQIPSLRDARGQGFGDFAALAGFAAAAGEAGADAVAISPVHALFPADPSRYGPYGPSTRLFLNILLADPGGGPDADEGGALIDWDRAIPRRVERLRRRFAQASDNDRAAVAAFAKDEGEALELHARHDALHGHFLRAAGARSWREWPSAYRDPRSPAVDSFAAEHRADVDFHIFCQWLAARGLEAAQAAAKRAGMAVGLIADLAVGMDPGGSHAWSRPSVLLEGLSVGAPPDPLGPDGQDWGITTFCPRALRRTGFADFIATLRAALRHAGGLRIDHAMGLKRLWVVPRGFPATRGAYLDYPQADLMRLLALESWRARAILVGEDLGTVPPGFRDAMDQAGMLGMRILWFERDSNGRFTPSGAWDEAAAAMSSTHDLPTIAGWWSERDVDWTWAIGRTSSFASPEAERAARAKDRRRLWRAIGRGAPQPAKAQPGDAVTAAIRHVGASACDLALIPVEDLLGLDEQPNLPGTVAEHPNWRRRLPVGVETMFALPEVVERIRALVEARRA